MRPGQKVFKNPGPDFGVRAMQPVAAGVAYTVYCTYNDPNGTSLDLYSWTDLADVRPGANQWVEQGGNWDIQGGEANIAAGVVRNAATLDCTVADGTVEVEMTIGPGFSTLERGLIYRFQGYWTWYWIAGIQQNPGTFAITEYAFGAPAVRASVPFVLVPGTTYTIQVVLAGNNHTATLDGGNTLNWVSATGAAATVHGIQDRDTSTFDDFWVI